MQSILGEGERNQPITNLTEILPWEPGMILDRVEDIS
jgi:hypothetical protein